MNRSLILLLVLFSWCYAPAAYGSASARQPVDWVDPFIGTTQPGLRWMLFPGPTTPFGMVKLSPDNRGPEGAGYDYKIGTLLGFSHIHSWIMSGLLMMPTTGLLKTAQGPESGSPESFRSHFRHSTEVAAPGYYAVTLDDYNIRAELTTTPRVGIERYTFPRADAARVLLVLNVPGETKMQVTNAVIRRVSPTEIEGESHQVNGYWERYLNYTLHFIVRFSRPFDSMGGWVGSKITPDAREITGQGDVGAFANYRTAAGEVIEVKTGISYVSIEQARLNLDAETHRFGWDFDAIRRDSCNTWNNLLKTIEIEGGTDTDRTKFYTNVYRSYTARTIFNDVNGKYVDPAGRVQQLAHPESPVMGCDAFWNTFWNLNQLWGLATPDILNQWVQAQLEIYDKGGWLAKAPGDLRYSGMMVAEHEIALLVSAWQKGIRNFDGQKSYEAIRHILTTPGVYYYKPHRDDNDAGQRYDYRPMSKEGSPDDDRNRFGWAGLEKLEPYRNLGYVPVEEGPTSLTLEYAYDDWCAAQLAKALGKEEDYQYFSKRAQNYRNNFDPSVGYFRPRHRDGTWATPFLPFDRRDYTEGTAWQYAWFVPHDMQGLIGLLGREEFVRRLNEGFESSRPDFASEDKYVNVGNEPNMEAPWLFNYAGAPWLTQKWTREVMQHSYHAEPSGYTGDEDQGQMASYFVLMALGIFEMDGGCSVKPIYEIGSPLFDRAVIHLDPKYYPGREFIIETKNNSKENVYVQSATFNGRPLTKPWIYHADAVKGGTLVLVMGPSPNRTWGSAAGDVPPQ